MRPSERLAEAVRAAAKRGEPAIVAFMTAGFPRKDHFREHLLMVASESDVVEIGVPFTDPMADGMTIQRSSQAALKQGVSLRWIMSELASMQRPAAPLVLMSYLNPLLQYGYAALARDAAAAGVCGFIVPDLPFDEGDELRVALAADTAVIYMGAGQAEAIANALIESGLVPSTPVALVESASLPQESHRFGVLAGLGTLADSVGTGPVIIVLGEVLREQLDAAQTAQLPARTVRRIAA